MLYNPYENNNQNLNSNGNNGQPAPGYGANPPYPPQPPKTAVPVGTPYTRVEPPQSTTYTAHQTQTGADSAGQVQQPAPPQGVPPMPQQPVPGAQTRSSYTWNTPGVSQQPAPYFVPQAPKKKKKRGGKIAVRIVAGVLCCAVISFGSVGAFALMIQNGVVDIKSSSGANKTAAFTINKIEGDKENSSNVVASDGKMTAQDVAQKLIPSVVCIQNYQINNQKFFFGGMTDGAGEQNASDVDPAGQGSGIILTKDGFIVTNQHVIDGATSLKVVTSDGLSYEAELVGQDLMTDLAVIKIKPTGDLTPADFGSSEDLKVADEVMAIGNPGGIQFNSSVTMGRVSALNREVDSSESGYAMNCIQTDAAINPGNSGGALVDLYGHVVGINSSKIVASGYEGLGFAIPSDTVQPIVSDLIEFGYVKDRAMLGISGQYVDSMTARFYGLVSGYYVQTLNTENAQKSGLKEQDVIIGIDETQITSQATISSYIAKKKPGEIVKLTVSRAVTGEEVTVELTLSESTAQF